MTTACLDMAAASHGQPALGETFSDEKLIQRIAAGDRPAMRTLFARHRVAVYRWLLRLVNDEALAEDLLSDVFLDVWRQAASFEARASVSTWLLAIARYKALSARRRRTDAELDDHIASTVADPADGPDLVLEKKSTTELMQACLAELSPEHREVMDLVYYHDKSVREVARIIGIPEPTVKTRMFYARKKLAELVAQRSAPRRKADRGTQSGALRPRINPCLYRLTKQRLAAGGGFAAYAGLPSPCHQIVLREMIMQERQVTAAVPIEVFELSANLSDRLALPCHLDRRHHPAWMPGNALVGRTLVQGKVPVGMAGHAGQITARQRHVRMKIVGLRWAIAHWMAVEAARMREHFGRFCK